MKDTERKDAARREVLCGRTKLYQLRLLNRTGTDLLVRQLARAAARALGKDRRPWPDFTRSLRSAFAKRIIHYQSCGALARCDVPPEIRARAKRRRSPIYLISLRGGVTSFLDALVRLAHWHSGLPGRDRALHTAFRQIITRYLYFAEKCPTCPLLLERQD